MFSHGVIVRSIYQTSYFCSQIYWLYHSYNRLVYSYGYVWLYMERSEWIWLCNSLMKSKSVTKLPRHLQFTNVVLDTVLLATAQFTVVFSNVISTLYEHVTSECSSKGTLQGHIVLLSSIYDCKGSRLDTFFGWKYKRNGEQKKQFFTINSHLIFFFNQAYSHLFSSGLSWIVI